MLAKLIFRLSAGLPKANQSSLWNLPHGLVKQGERALSHNTALVTKIHRKDYIRQYQVLVVEPDGTSYYIRYSQPRAVIQLPVDVATLTPEELKIRLDNRKPKKKVTYIKEEKDNYQSSKYINLVKGKKKKL